FETIRLKNTGFQGKSLWDWMELLVIPFVLALGAFYLNRSERAVERQIAEDRAKLEREIATDRQQEAALQSYLDRIADLLLNAKLLTTESDEVRNVARVRTLTVLRGLDSMRKGIILKFLVEAGLIKKEKPVVDLRGADLSTAHLIFANLERVNLEGADLRRSNLRVANLEGANLNSANLGGADLTAANLESADLSSVNFDGADLKATYLMLTNLESAHLSGANLEGANLMGADLSGADLENANLRGASLFVDKQLATVNFLKGAIMPDGTRHE
ncbi:MAG TPA: pentapeptide repeat-containing protein, partial [Anaerolineales bacterium]|nr:pentapeptide repeat-containing protein [Anaerolineales bacterium]